MKRVAFGALLRLARTVFSAAFLLCAALNPWDYNGIPGLPGALPGTGAMAPFVLSTAVLAAGPAVCGYKAYRRK